MDDYLAWFWMIISVTQFSDFWVMSYGNWKHILDIFSFHNSIFNGISVIKTTYWVPRSESATTFDPLFFLLLFLSLGSVSLAFWFFFFFSLGSVSLGIGGWRETKKVKAALSYKYGAHKQLKILSDDNLSDGAKRVGCRELGYFKW